jgi:hypothetical protein
VALGALARIWGNDYGLPHTYHPDEGYIVSRAIRFHGGDLDPRFFNWPSLYMYALSGVYGVLFGWRGVVQAFSEDAATFYLVGRTLTALMGTATIGVVYGLGTRLYGTAVGVLAAVFMAVNLLHIRDSHYITTDVPLTFLLAVSQWFTTRYWQEGRRGDAWWSGLFAGLAASMKYPGGVAVLALLFAHFARPRPAGPRWRQVLGPPLIGAGVLALAGFLVGTPYAVITPINFVRGVLSELREVHTVQFGNEADLPGYLFHLLHSFPEGMGYVPFGLALVGLVCAVVRPGWREAILLAFPLPYFLVIGTWSSRFERYVLPILPFLAVLAALGLVRLVTAARERLDGRTGGPLRALTPAAGLALAAALVVGPEVVRIVHWHLLLARPDTRQVAGAWIEARIPAGARIAMEPYSPAIRLSAAMVRAERDRLGNDVTAQVARRRFDRFLATAGAQAHEGYWMFRLATYDLAWLRERRVEYVVLSGFTYQRHQRACDRFVEACRFYRELERLGTLVYAIEPGREGQTLWVGDIYSPLTRLSDRTRPGPPIKVYRLPATG